MDKKDFFYIIVEPVLYAEQSPYKLMTEKLNGIQMDCFLGYDSLGGRVNKEMKFDMDIKRHILNDFISYGNELIAQRTKDIEKEVVEKTRSLVQQSGDQTKVLRCLIEALEDTRRFVRKQVTLIEHLSGSNDKDVFKYYHALVEHPVWTCRMLMRRRTGQYLMHLANVLSHEFGVSNQCYNK